MSRLNIDSNTKEIKGKSYKTSLRQWLLMLIVVIAAGVLVYFIKPYKKSFKLFSHGVTGKQFSCTVKLGSTIFPRPNLQKNPNETVDAEITNQGSKVAIEIQNDKLKFLTDTAVGIGIATPAEFTIVREDENSLQAIDLERDISIDPGLDTFILNKQSGFATWSKSKPAFLSDPYPDIQAYYLVCL